MKKLLNVLERGAMFVLALMPVIAIFARHLMADEYVCDAWFAAQTMLASLIGLLPTYVGNYTETDVLRYEGGRHGNDPDPDRQAVHELVREGHRFPVRLPASILFAVLVVIVCAFLPGKLFFDGSTVRKVIFTAGMLVLSMTAMYSASSYCMFTETPGVVLGFLIYLGMALFLNFSKEDNSDIQLLISLCALAYLFLGGLCLNRSALSVSAATGDNTRSAPRQILRRNRRIVLGFTGAAAVVSFVGPIRSGAEWLFDRFLDLLRFIERLLGIGNSTATEADLSEMMGAGTAAETAEEAVQEVTSGAGDMIIVYVFFGILAICVVWIVCDGVRKMLDKLSKLLGKFATGISEGYYDEREEIKDGEEADRKLSGLLRDRLKKLLARETPWEKLSPREKVRRLLRDVYKRRGRKVKSLKNLTAREALKEMDLGSSKMGELYDRARYSEHDVENAEPEALRKEIRP